MALISFDVQTMTVQAVKNPEIFSQETATGKRPSTGKHIRFHKLIMQHLFCTYLLLLLYNFCDAQIISHTTFFGRILVHIRIHAPFVPHAPS